VVMLITMVLLRLVARLGGVELFLGGLYRDFREPSSKVDSNIICEVVLRSFYSWLMLPCRFTVVITITAVILLLIHAVHPIIKGTVVIPLVPLNASMACRVYRNLKQFDHRHADSEMNTKDLLFSV
jgi:hypothetical protein